MKVNNINGMIKSFALIALVLVGMSCKTKASKTNDAQEAATVNVPTFCADSAYVYVDKQVKFGPRVPNTEEHAACGNYLAQKLESFGAKVTNQYADLMAYDGKMLKARNIIGSYNPASKKRIALFAHWDCRPWADNDRNKDNQHKPILGANDGASGVGVLLEIARQIQKQAPALGIDIIFFDAEDYGAPEFYKGEHKDEYWCLGAQYWARTPHVENYKARFGILLDMVGAAGSTFYKESISMEHAGSQVKKVWSAAKRLGFDNYFIDEEGGSVTDDHVFVNNIAQIPTLDIIPNQINAKYSSFGDTWHTLDDNMNVIDKATLNAVGKTVLNVIYNEK